MREIVKLPPTERAEIFDIAAAKMKIPAGLIEKDFWVCYILDILFQREKQQSMRKSYTEVNCDE